MGVRRRAAAFGVGIVRNRRCAVGTSADGDSGKCLACAGPSRCGADRGGPERVVRPGRSDCASHECIMGGLFAGSQPSASGRGAVGLDP